MKLVLYIEGTEIDLFDDESLILNRSVQNVRDITKIFSDFSQSFKVPASARNNKVLGSSRQGVYSYSTTEHQVQRYNTRGEEFMTLSSGFVPEGFSEVIKQLLLSEYVWVDGKPVIVITPEQEMQKQINKGLINYFVEFRYSNNIINNVI